MGVVKPSIWYFRLEFLEVVYIRKFQWILNWDTLPLYDINGVILIIAGFLVAADFRRIWSADHTIRSDANSRPTRFVSPVMYYLSNDCFKVPHSFFSYFLFYLPCHPAIFTTSSVYTWSSFRYMKRIKQLTPLNTSSPTTVVESRVSHDFHSF